MKSKIKGLIALLGIFCSVTNASPIISEVLYDAVGSDAGKTFIELFGVPGESLDGLSLEAVNGANGSVYLDISLSGFFPEDGIFVIGDELSGLTNVTGADMFADVNLQNGPDSLVLRNETVILDALGYGEFTDLLFNAGEGDSAEDVGAGLSLVRQNVFIDTNNNAVDFVSSVPTPGVIPVSPVPLPVSFYLLSSGLLALAGISRRRII